MIEFAEEKKTVTGLTPEEEFIWKWQYRIHGDFKKALLNAILKADDTNLERLAMGFPVEVSAIKKYWHEDGWWQSIKDKAKELKLPPFDNQNIVW